MRYERLLTDKAPLRDPPCARSGDALSLLALVQLALAGLALLATLAFWTLAEAPPGLQQLLILCLVRLAALLCVGAISYRTFSRRRTESPASGGASPKSAAAHSTLYLQLIWLATELLLGSALLFIYPNIPGPTFGGLSPSAALTLLPLCCAAVMSGCFLFLRSFSRRRGGQQRGSDCCGSAGAGLPRSLHQFQAHSHQQYAASGSGSQEQLHPYATHSGSHHQLDILCSPVSDSGSFSSAASCSSGSYYPRSCGSWGGAPSPTGHLYSGDEAAEQRHEAALQAACEIVLMEHQLDTNEWCLFVHKRLRPIKTRPEEKNAPAAQPGLLRELITNSFTFQNDPDLAAQLAASMRAVAGGGSSDGNASGARTITFQCTAAATDVV